MLHWIICSKNKNIGNIWQEVSSYIHMKLVHAGAPSVLLFSIGKLWELTSSSWKLIEILILLNSYTDWIKYLGRNKVYISSSWKTEIVSCRSSVGLSFLNWEITGPYKFLLKNNWNINFVKMLHWIICLKRKNIGNVLQEVSSVIHMTERNCCM